MSDVKRLLSEATSRPMSLIEALRYYADYPEDVVPTVLRDAALVIVDLRRRLPKAADYEAAVDALDALITAMEPPNVAWVETGADLDRLNATRDEARAALARLREPVPA